MRDQQSKTWRWRPPWVVLFVIVLGFARTLVEDGFARAVLILVVFYAAGLAVGWLLSRRGRWAK